MNTKLMQKESILLAPAKDKVDQYKKDEESAKPVESFRRVSAVLSSYEGLVNGAKRLQIRKQENTNYASLVLEHVPGRNQDDDDTEEGRLITVRPPLTLYGSDHSVCEVITYAVDGNKETKQLYLLNAEFLDKKLRELIVDALAKQLWFRKLYQ